MQRVTRGEATQPPPVATIEDVARDALGHLAAQGYRRIGILAGPQDTMTGRDRLAGYRLGLRDAGLAHDPLLEYAGHYDESSGYQGTLRLLDVPVPVDALFTTSNSLAVGALRALRERGKWLLIRRLQHPEEHVLQQVILQHRLKIGDTSPPVRRLATAPAESVPLPV